MFRTIRTLMSLVVLVAVVWWTFTYRVGDSTVAEHLERIGETPEAKGLIKGAKTRMDPVLDEAKQRMIGEYIEAPTAPVPTSRRVESAARSTAKLVSAAQPPPPAVDLHPKAAQPGTQTPGDAHEPDLPTTSPTAMNAANDPSPEGEAEGEEAGEDDTNPPAMPETKDPKQTEPSEKAASMLLQPSTPRTSRLPGRR